MELEKLLKENCDRKNLLASVKAKRERNLQDILDINQRIYYGIFKESPQKLQ